MKKYIRWSFLLAFVLFAALIRHSRVMTLNPNLFIVLWLLGSFAVVFGVVAFRDKAPEGDSAGGERAEV